MHRRHVELTGRLQGIKKISLALAHTLQRDGSATEEHYGRVRLPSLLPCKGYACQVEPFERVVHSQTPRQMA